jgi:hypothetical protein
MSTIRRGEQLKHAHLKASFGLAHFPSLFEILRLYQDEEFSITMNFATLICRCA